MRRLEGKVIVVAGGATGIGAATAQRLAAEGAAVVVGDISGDGADALARKIVADGGKAIGIAFDIAADSQVKSLVQAAVQSFGGLDGMHANAADFAVIRRDFDALEIALDDFDRTLAVDLRGYLLCIRHAIPELLKRGGGAIVLTGSGAAFAGEDTRVAYGVAKAGVTALARHVASRWGKQGIRANTVSPGLVMSEAAQRTISQEVKERFLKDTCSTRLGEPSDIAAMVAMLMSQDGAWINGQTLVVDGGDIFR
jgi:NAD(P)-dependent dehydrogenase (short-subunit alcohol dehydrogenase family)